MFNKLNHYDFPVNPVRSLQSFLRIWGRYWRKLFYIGESHARYAFQAIFGLYSDAAPKHAIKAILVVQPQAEGKKLRDEGGQQ